MHNVLYLGGIHLVEEILWDMLVVEVVEDDGYDDEYDEYDDVRMT